METYWNPATRKNGLSDKNGRGVYARELSRYSIKKSPKFVKNTVTNWPR